MTGVGRKMGKDKSKSKGKRRISIFMKSIPAIVIPIVLITVIACVAGYKSLTEAITQVYTESSLETAETAASMVDVEKLDDYLISGGVTEEYKLAVDEIENLCNTSGSMFIYVIQPDLSDYDHITFIFSTINSESTFSRYDVGYYRQTTNDDYKAKYRRLYEGASDYEIVVRDRGYIETDAHLTTMVPLKDEHGVVQGILCVQTQMSEITEKRNAYTRNMIIVLLVIVFVVVIAQGRYLRMVLITPIKKITEEASRFAAENKLPETRISDVVRSRDEIGYLAESISNMEEDIVRNVNALTSATAEKERISTELNLATRIQADMLPNIFPAFPERKELDIFASMNPAKEVGGDFYDYYLIDDDHLCLVMADVSGKGVPAALFMMASMITIANHAKTGKCPSQILHDTNMSLSANNREDMFVTVWIGILEISTGHLTAANAGHEYPVIRNADGKFELLKDTHGFVLGAYPGTKYKDYEVMLSKGSALFLYTDGVPEAVNKYNDEYGTGRMTDALNSRGAGATPHELITAVRKDLDKFVDGADQFDDITMLCVEYRGPDK